MTAVNLPPLPEPGYLGDGASHGYGVGDLCNYATATAEAHAAALHAQIERLTADHAALLNTCALQTAEIRALGEQVTALTAALDAAQADAKRYRWLKSRNGLTLRSEKQPNTWTRMDGTKFSASRSLSADGTQYAPAATLDELIDAAAIAAERQK